MTQEPVTTTRSAFVDQIRIVLTVLVIWHHSIIMFGGPGGWYMRTEVNSKLAGVLFAMVCSVDQAFFMGAFFLLSGYYTPAAYDKKGPWRFAVDRLWRLAIPLLVYGYVIGPMTVALAATRKGESFLSSWRDLMLDSTFDIGPLWFAYALLIFSAAYMFWRNLSARLSMLHVRSGIVLPSDSLLFLAAIVTGAGAFLLRLWVPVGTQFHSLQIGYFSSYIVLFIAGCALARSKALEKIDATAAKRWGWISLAVIPSLFVYAIVNGALSGVPFPSNGGWTLPALAYALWEPFVAWGIILMLLWRFRVRNFSSPVWKRCAPLAYTAYIIHPPVIVVLGLLLSDRQIPSLLKFAITGSIGPVVIFSIAALICAIPGAKKIL